jgi:hypothetical protein
MMMAEVANHGKRSHADSYFGGKGVTATANSSEEFGTMNSKKPRNNQSTRTAPPISSRARDPNPSVSQRSCLEKLSCRLIFLVAVTFEQEKKDKIGERVAALQQLVSQFGKVCSSLTFSLYSCLSFHVWK